MAGERATSNNNLLVYELKKALSSPASTVSSMILRFLYDISPSFLSQLPDPHNILIAGKEGKVIFSFVQYYLNDTEQFVRFDKRVLQLAL
jgi:hypothetical protein